MLCKKISGKIAPYKNNLNDVLRFELDVLYQLKIDFLINDNLEF